MESLLVMIALNKRPVFIVGSPRSGTTLLHHMLVSSGGFALYRTESGVFAILGPRFGDLSVRRNREQLMEHWLRSDLFMLTGLDSEYIRARILNGTSNAAVRIWGPRTHAVDEGILSRRRDLKGPAIRGGAKGFEAYAEVLLTGSTNAASYVLGVTASTR